MSYIGHDCCGDSQQSSSGTTAKFKQQIIEVNDGELGAGVTSNYAGLVVDRGTLPEAKLLWNESITSWEFGIGDTIQIIGEGGSSKYDISIISNNTNAAVFKFYYVDLTQSPITVSLPNSPANGDWVGFSDIYGKSDTNTLTIHPLNSLHTVRNTNSDLEVDVNYVNFKLVFFDNNWTVFDMSAFIGGEVSDSGTGSGTITDLKYNIISSSANFTAVSLRYYLINTSTQNISVSLPTSPVNGDWFIISDQNHTFDVHKVTVLYTNKTIFNTTSDLDIDFKNAKLKFVYYNNNWDILNLS